METTDFAIQPCRGKGGHIDWEPGENRQLPSALACLWRFRYVYIYTHIYIYTHYNITWCCSIVLVRLISTAPHSTTQRNIDRQFFFLTQPVPWVPFLEWTVLHVSQSSSSRTTHWTDWLKWSQHMYVFESPPIRKPSQEESHVPVFNVWMRMQGRENKDIIDIMMLSPALERLYPLAPNI